MPDADYHGWTHRPKWLGGSDPARVLGHYELKVFADRNALDGELPDEAIVVSAGDGKFIFAIPYDLDGTALVHAAAYVSAAGAVTVQLRNITQAHDFLSTAVTIDGGDNTSYDAATPPVITEANREVNVGDLISVDVDAADGTAEGLGVILVFAAL